MPYVDIFVTYIYIMIAFFLQFLLYFLQIKAWVLWDYIKNGGLGYFAAVIAFFLVYIVSQVWSISMSGTN